MPSRSKSPVRTSSRRSAAVEPVVEIAPVVTAPSVTRRSRSKSVAPKSIPSATTSKSANDKMTLASSVCSSQHKWDSLCTCSCLKQHLYLATLIALSVGLLCAMKKWNLADTYLNPIALKICSCISVHLGYGVITKPRTLLYCLVLGYSLITYLIATALTGLASANKRKQVGTLSLPRQENALLGGLTARLSGAQLNLAEAFPLLLASILVGIFAGLDDWHTVSTVHLFIALRIGHYVAYAADLPTIRSAFFLTAVLSLLDLQLAAIIRSI